MSSYTRETIYAILNCCRMTTTYFPRAVIGQLMKWLVNIYQNNKAGDSCSIPSFADLISRHNFAVLYIHYIITHNIEPQLLFCDKPTIVNRYIWLRFLLKISVRSHNQSRVVPYSRIAEISNLCLKKIGSQQNINASYMYLISFLLFEYWILWQNSRENANFARRNSKRSSCCHMFGYAKARYHSRFRHCVNSLVQAEHISLVQAKRKWVFPAKRGDRCSPKIFQ